MKRKTAQIFKRKEKKDCPLNYLYFIETKGTTIDLGICIFLPS
jgi:hypothetical protein